MKKTELLTSLENSREELLSLLEEFSDEDYTRVENPGDWSVKDLLSHLTRWEAELVKLLWQVRQGQRPTTVHFSRMPIDEINAHWIIEDGTRPLERVLVDFHGVRNQTIRRLEGIPDRDLTDPQRYSSLKGKALWEWVTADTIEHEAEHTSQIRRLRPMQDEASTRDQ